jgi:arylsulfatase B/arylsulfatase I/J
VLDNYYVYRFCSPSRSQILTGRYAWHLGQQTEMNLNPMPGIACGISLEYAFMPKMLKEAGYATWALGKWHQGFLTDAYTPTLRGFDHYVGYYSGAEEHFTHEKLGYPAPSGATEKSGYWAYDLANSSGSDVRPCLPAVGNASATYSAYLYANETLRMLAAHDPATPLFVYLAWNNVHDPNEAPDEYVAKHPNIANMPRRQLAGMMSVLDDSLTAVIDGLKHKGMWDDTLLVISTDNGGNLGGSGRNWPLRGGKYTFWQGGVRGIGMVSGGDNVLPKAVRGSTWRGAVHQVTRPLHQTPRLTQPQPNPNARRRQPSPCPPPALRFPP